MKTLFVIVFIFIFCSSINAQWEKVGYPGGGLLIYQYDDVLIGSSGNQVYKSTDDGEHWKLFENGLPTTTFVSDYAIFTVNDTLYLQPRISSQRKAEEYKDTYYRISKNADKWQEWKGKPPFPKSYIHTVSADTIVYIGALPEGVTSDIGFQVSTDGGNTWQGRRNGIPGTQIGFYKHYIYGSNIIIQVAYLDTVYRSDSTISLEWRDCFFTTSDLGLHWDKLIKSVKDSMYQFQHLLRVDSSTFLYFASSYVGKPLMLFSQDGCNTWVDTISGIDATVIGNVWQFKHFDSVLFLSFEDIAEQDPNHKCYLSYDLGKTWTRKQALTFSRNIHSVLEKKVRGDGYLLTIMTSTDPFHILDKNFNIIKPITFEGVLEKNVSTVFVDDNKIVGTAYTASINISSDDGLSWKLMDNPSPSSSDNYWLKGEKYLFRTEGYTNDYHALLRTKDVGVLWDTVDLPFGMKGKFSFANASDTLILIYQHPDTLTGSTFLSFNGGDNWRQINTPFADPHLVQNIFIDGENIYVIPENNWRYFLSSNMGTSWKSIEIVDNQFTYGVDYKQFSMSDDWLFCYGIKPFATNSASPFLLRANRNLDTWEILETNLSDEINPVSITQIGRFLLMLSLSYNDKINSDGTCRVLKSSDNGVTWTQVGENLRRGYYLSHNSKYLYVSGAKYSPALYRYPLALAGIHDSKPNNNNSLSLSAYPNPAAKELTISLTTGRPERVVMYDMTGALIKSGVVEGETTWDVSTLASGSYMLGIPGGKMQVVQVVK
jgi:hypothetical protein